MDESGDWRRYVDNGVLQFLEALKAQGVVRHIGLSTHTPALAREVLDTGLADMMMFSINPSYDYQHGEYANGSATERMALYRRCEAEGVGISVMKAFAGGQLLDARTSPFGQALTEYQCIQYALDKPGVLTVLPGVRDRADLERVLGFLRAGEAERDYSVISSLTPRDAEGTCVYCNHCQPCPAGLDVGLINKYYDLARAGDALAAEHYRSLSLGADACISCGHCDRRCPFHVSQSARMREIDLSESPVFSGPAGGEMARRGPGRRQELPAVCPAAGSLPAGLRPAAAVRGAVSYGKPDSGAAEGGGAPAGGPGTGAGRHPPNHQRH